MVFSTDNINTTDANKGLSVITGPVRYTDFFNRWTSKPPLPGLLLYTSTDTQKGFFFFIKEFFFRVFVDRKLANHCISYALSIYRVFNAKSGLIELH